MITIIVQIQDKGAGQLDIRFESPASPSVTQPEVAIAGLVMDTLKSFSHKMLGHAGNGIVVESAAAACPKCQTKVPTMRGVHLYKCPACGSDFGA